ncbi:MAG: DUF4843 domain-containing protein [Mangrovibacterium sp.]
MKKYIYIMTLLLALGACQLSEVHKYLGENYVQFTPDDAAEVANTTVDEFYSFAYVADDVKRDTFWVDAHVSGEITEGKRYYKLKQSMHYTEEIEYDIDGSILNETIIETPDQAVSGVHYVSFDDPDFQEMCYVENNDVNFKVPIIVLRDNSLKKVDKLLNVEFEESDDFKVGNYSTRQQVVMISDNVTYPTWWSEDGPGSIADGWKLSTIFGYYGPVKHRLMIQVTGEKWDNDFLEGLTREERLGYKNICSKALYELNQERIARGETELMEDANFRFGPVEFP